MKNRPNSSPLWSMACFAERANATGVDLNALGEHVHVCRIPHRRLFALRCVAESFNGFVAARFVTSLLLIALPLSAGLGLIG